MSPEKSELRKRFLTMRRSLSMESAEQRSFTCSKQIRENFLSGVSSVMMYVPINREIDLIPLAKDLFREGVALCFPKILNDEVRPYLLHDFDFDFKLGAYNIPEPDTEEFSGSLDLILVPGVAFSRDLYRVGYGKGYYDRFLSSFPHKKAVGVAYDFQLLPEVPHDGHDVRLDAVVGPSILIVKEDL